jgi:ribosomal protein S2
MDLKLCRENHTFEKMIDLLHMRKMTYIDGDAINIVATIQHFPKNFVVMGTKNIKNSIIHHTCYVSKNYLLSVFN